MTLTSCTFELTDSAADIDVQISGAGTKAQMIGCEFNGNSIAGTPEALGIKVTNNAFLDISSGTMQNYTTGIQVGLVSDGR